jgi:CRISPR-associated protein Cas6
VSSTLGEAAHLTAGGFGVDRMVDLAFPVRGPAIPADHGYALFSALCRLAPGIHSEAGLGIHAINGRTEGPRRLVLTNRSTVRLRLAVQHIPEYVALAGRRLEIEGQGVTLGFPSLISLVPAASAFSRLVIIRGFTEAEPFLEAVQRQLAMLNIKAIPALVARPATKPREHSAGGKGPWVRRTLRLRDKDIVGFALRVDQLTAEESIRLQEHGVGGRRHFGCGLFIAPAGTRR